MKTDFLTLNRTPYENGFISGQYFRTRLNSEALKNTPLSKKPELKDRCQSMMNKLKMEYPVYYEEVIGKADGLKMDRLEYFSIMCPELFQFGFEHCTTIVAKKDNGHYVLSHNEDDQFISNNFCMSKVFLEDGSWFMTNDMFNMPFGNGISYNSFGLVKTINYTHEECMMPDNLPRYFGQRHISEARSIDDLIQRCKEMKTASGFHVTAIDINSAKAVSIEVYHDSISIIEIKDFYIHSNHYIHGSHAANQMTDPGSNSIFRLNQARRLMKDSHRDLESIKKVLTYRSTENQFENSILQTQDDPYLTLFNFSIDTEQPDILYLDVNIADEKLTLAYD